MPNILSHQYNLINFRTHPELYQIGRGEQGVLLVEPYKSEILPFWRFRTAFIARRSAAKIYQLFLHYRRERDFVGMDMARKFLQMGFTRARRYANHSHTRPLSPDAIFYHYYCKARMDSVYQILKKIHTLKYG